jgi:hypothetical protein
MNTKFIRIFFVTTLFGILSCNNESVEEKEAVKPADSQKGAPYAQVYVGGGLAYNEFTGNNDSKWSYVRANATGWYVNNFNLLRFKNPKDKRQYAEKIAAKFANKTSFYETDFLVTSLNEDKENIDVLRAAGVNPVYTTLNRGFTTERKNGLKWRDANRPLLAMVPPWQVKGDFNKSSNSELQNIIKRCQGSSTDGPMTLWADNIGNMRIGSNGEAGGSASLVKWTKKINSKFVTMVMMAPNESNGAEFLARVKDCVRMHERFDARPTIYVLSFYGPARFDKCPILPELDSKGNPANTFAGACYWVMKHVRGELK